MIPQSPLLLSGKAGSKFIPIPSQMMHCIAQNGVMASCALSLAVELFSMLTRRFAALIVTGEYTSGYRLERRTDDDASGIPTLIFRLKIVLTVSARQRLSESSVSSQRRVSKKLCMLVRGTSSISTTRSSKPVDSTTNQHRKSRKNSW
jgi:hypothetical protein